jgi:diadenosine tetraphosphate (Ap4A) HIT family hydrolase
MSFTLHERLQQDCLVLGGFPLARLLLMNDSRFPWYILVPARVGIREIHQLEWMDQVQLLRESTRLSDCLTRAYQPDKLNIAVIGNLVPQLHLHHVVRYHYDAVWPAPVWGVGRPKAYAPEQLAEIVEKMRGCLERSVVDQPEFVRFQT